MIPKRVKQFYVNVTDKMTEKDYDYANEILNKKELELFMKLSKSEQKHSISCLLYTSPSPRDRG